MGEVEAGGWREEKRGEGECGDRNGGVGGGAECEQTDIWTGGTNARQIVQD